MAQIGLFLCFICIVSRGFAIDKWPNLSTTFPNFHLQPRTSSQAEEDGWVKVASCDGKFLGHRYAKSSDPSMILIFDDAGYIAGVQSVVPVKQIHPGVNMTLQPAYQLDTWFEEPAYLITAYFVEHSIICEGGRSADDFELQGNGDRLVIQTGKTTHSFHNIPLTQEEADSDPVWYAHLCTNGMGLHYSQFNYEKEQDCNKVLPIQILFHDGVIHGFVWQHFANLPGSKWEHLNARAVRSIIRSPPKCLMKQVIHHGLSSMHVYFVDFPWTIHCPTK